MLYYCEQVFVCLLQKEKKKKKRVLIISDG